MNISEMKPGCELNAQVAEKVMRWHKDERPGHFHWLDNDNETTGYDWLDKPIKAFSPSTKIAAVWEVVEKLAAHGFQFSISCNHTWWRASFWLSGKQFPEENQADSHEGAPLAICLATLKAVGS